jgi:hypothetical protein
MKKGVPERSEPMWRIAVPYAVWLVLDLAASTGAFRTFGSTWFSAVGPGGSPPWYFIGQDLVEAAWASGAMILMMGFCLAAARRLGPNVWAALAVAQLGFVTKLGSGMNVLVHTKSAWQRTQASSDWGTFDAYAGSQSSAFNASLVVGVIMAILCMWQYGRTFRAAR